jgi:hypothetical protein
MRLTTFALGLSALAVATVANAAPNIVQNGGFETTTNSLGQLGYNTDATGWSVPRGGYAFLFTPGSADTTGANGQYGNLQIYGPGNGSANGLTASSPFGGNYVALDGAFQVQPIQQTLATIIGHTYNITFAFAGAQQTNFSGPTTEAFNVCLGTQCQETSVLNNASHGFTGWQTASFNFTAQTTSDILSFLAIGTPNGQPPFSLLDGVVGTDITAVPEAATLGLLGLGLGLAAVARRRK